ncbi:MAG: NUDIX domain-containing protein, partial [Pseudomonadota bacterium]
SARSALLELPGIGPYTASAIAAIAFDAPETVLDGNVERVVARLFDDHSALPKAKPIFYAHAQKLTPKYRAGDYAQAIMDLGATICTPRNPTCGLCPWRAACAAYAAGTVSDLPQKTPKKPKPTRYGIAYVVRRADGAYLLETRPEKGLLGGMLGWPGTEWADQPDPAEPCAADWRSLSGEVRHTFTHFHLILTVKIADVGMELLPKYGEFKTMSDFRPGDLPTVMRKVFDLAHAAA